MARSTTSSTTHVATYIYSKGGVKMKMEDLIKFQNDNDLYLVSIWLEDTVKQINRYRTIPDELRELRIILMQVKHDIEDRIKKYETAIKLSAKYKRSYL